MADLRKAGEASARAAETLLRGTGGRAVRLRLPVAANAGDEAEQLGLATPLFQEVELAPCVFRKTGSRAELLVSAIAVQRLVGSLQFDSAKLLFATAAGVLVDDDLLEMDRSDVVEQMGTPVCYRLVLRAA